MGIFKKEEEVLDLTDLQRRGLLRKAQAIEQRLNSPQRNESYFDMSNAGVSSAGAQPGPPSPPSPPSGGGQFDFLDALAGVGASSSSGGSAGSSVTSDVSSGPDSLEIQGLKNKIDDLEYKLDRLMEKIAKLEGS